MLLFFTDIRSIVILFDPMEMNFSGANAQF